MKHLKHLLLALSLLLLVVSSARAWNAQGHMVISQIAYDNLRPDVKARCDALIAVPVFGVGITNNTFVTAACWADDIKSSTSAFDIWHYINIPFSLDGTATNLVCIPANPQDTNVVWAINHCVAALQNPSTSLSNQAVYLRFLLHFVGDVAQPLHCHAAVSATHTCGDAGGNIFPILGFPSNLHSLWDRGAGYVSATIARPLTAGSHTTLTNIVNDVLATYPYAPGFLAPPDPMTWAIEGQGLAQTVGYVGITPSTTPSAGYLATGQATAKQQLARGGQRLADLLNAILAPSAFTNALSFDGTSQHVVVTNFGNIMPTNEVTVEFWAYTTAITDSSAFGLNPDNGVNRFHSHLTWSSGDVFWDFGNITTTGRIFTNYPANSLTNWIHYAMVASQSGNTMKIYTNGILSATKTGMDPFERYDADLRIGGGYAFYQGQIDEFRVWNTARSQAQIQANLGTPLSGNETNLLLYYRFDNASGNVATNFATLSGTAFNGTLVNSPTWVASTAPSTVVLNTNDAGSYSLRRAIFNAPAGSTITFDQSLSGQTILLTNGQLLLQKNLAIDATALPGGITVSANNASRLFYVTNAATVSLAGLTLANGSQPGQGGGGIQSDSDTMLIVSRCTLINNPGGAILNYGAMQLVQSTLHGNSAFYGGAVHCEGLTTISHCTIAGNTGSYGGGVFNKSTTLTLSNSIIAGNVSLVWGDPNAQAGRDVYSQIAALVYSGPNIVPYIYEQSPTTPAVGSTPITSAPLLSALANYGGPTQTMPPLPGSPAVDGCTSGSGFVTDQRGASYPRVMNAYADIGAVEALVPSIPNSSFEANSFTVFPGYVSGNGPITGWAATANSGLNPASGNPFADNGAIPHGVNVAFIQGGNDTLSNTISGLTPSETYLVTFRANVRSNTYAYYTNASPNSSWSLNGSSYAPFQTDPPPGGSNPYYTNSGVFTATATTAALMLRNTTALDTTSVVDDFRISVYTNAANLVINANDSGLGSLRQAIAFATNNSTITFSNSLAGQTILLTKGQIVLERNLTIDGSTLANGISINGNNAGRIFHVASGTTNLLTALTITNGNVGNGHAGGIYNAGVLMINRCTISGNTGRFGGGVFNNNILTLNQSTLTGNSADYGGAILHEGQLFVKQSTITSNTATSTGGAIRSDLGMPLELNNSIVTGNSPDNVTEEEEGGVSFSGVNLTSGNPLLAPLGNYGGPTQTMPPLPGSPAIDAGGATSFITDQRGLTRVVDGNGDTVAVADIGAVEVGHPVNVTVDPAKSWIGFMNVFNLPISGGAFQFGSPWATADLNAFFTGPALTLTPNTSIDRDEPNNAYWFIGGTGAGNKTMDANMYVEDSALTNGQTVIFSGYCASNTLVLPYTSIAFIRDFTPDYSSVTQTNFPLVTGQPFTLSMLTAAGHHIQYGFDTVGPNARLASVASLGRVIVGPPLTTPVVTTFNATGVTNTTATLNGTVNPNGAATTAWFEWGATTNYGNQTTPVALGGGYTTISFSNILSGFTQGITNHYRLVATNSAGTTPGNDIAFGSPIITLIGAASITNECPNSFTDPGANNSAGFSVAVSGSVNPNSPNSYILTYTGTNTLGGSGTTTRTVLVNDTLPPVLTMLGANPLTILTNTPFVDPGATASDLCNVTATLSTNSTVNVSVPGSYSVTYIANDGNGNSATNTRNVIVRGPTTLVVLNNNDSGPDSLRQVVADSISGDTVQFTNTLSGATIILSSGELVLDKNLTIDASTLTNGISVDANGTSRVMRVKTSQTVVLNFLTVTNGSVQPECLDSACYVGGGIANEGTLTMNHCAVVGCRNNIDGGGGAGIFNSGILTLNQSTVASNVFNTFGHGIGILNRGMLMLNESTVSGNQAGSGGGFGGGINNSHGSVTLNESTVSGNQADSGGGLENLSGTLTVNNSILTNNSAGSGGGGINNQSTYNGSYWISGIVTISNSTFANNSAGAGGGAINNSYQATATVINSTFANNSAGSGGGIDNLSTLSVSQGTFSGNSANLGGGINNLYFLSVSQSTFSGNSANLGGGIHNGGGFSFNLTNTIVCNNTATGDPNIYCSSPANICGSIPASVNNLVDANALLAPLGNYGGPTMTMPPLPGSPAIDAGAATTLTTDQRSLPRVVGAAVDIGAVEVQIVIGNAPFLTGLTQLGNGSFQFSFTNVPNASLTVWGSTNAALPFAQWSNLGAPVESPAGTFQFADPQATNYSERFYRVTSP